MIHSILRLPAVKATTGLSRSTIYLRIKAGEFPAQVSLGARAVGWLEAEIERWIATQVERSRQPARPVKRFPKRATWFWAKLRCSGTSGRRRTNLGTGSE